MVYARTLQVMHSITPLIIDCTRIFEAADRGMEPVSALLGWVQAYPRRAEIQVRLGGRDRIASRKLQSRLQALGCRVTTTHASAR
jgi:hypothetical protein